LHDPVTRASLQVKFIDFILVPWWDQMSRLFPGLKACQTQLLQNREFYQGRAAGNPGPAQPASTAAAPPPQQQQQQQSAPSNGAQATPAPAAAEAKT